jgi:DNA-binding NarL/FixJ family response regulator
MSDLILAIRAVSSGGTYFSTMAPKVILNYMKNLEEGMGPDNFKKLSLREREIFQLLAEGNTIKDIATQLGIDAKTVQSHKYNIFEKLNVKTLTDLIRIAVRQKVIHI